MADEALEGAFYDCQSLRGFDFLAHASCLGVVDPECRTVEMLCDLVAKHRERAELTDLGAVARTVG